MNTTNQASNIEDSYPLSPLQQRMLFQSQLADKGGIYIQQLLLSIHEELDVPAFIRAWNDVLARHDALRSAFRWEGLEEPLQDIHTGITVPFELLDWRYLSDAEQQKRLEEFIELDRKKGFNLAEAPLMRLTLIRVTAASYQLVWTHHHIIISNRTNRIALEDAFAIYDAYRQGGRATLPETRPFRDYIDWLRGLDISGAEDYWRQLLQGFRDPTPIGPLKFSNKQDNDNQEFGLFEISVSEGATASLKALAKQNQITLNTFIQGAWALLLSRYSGEEDIVFGEMRANRKWDIEAADRIAGLLLNMLPLRVQVNPGEKLLPWLQELRQTQLAMREHENTPLIDVQRWSDVPWGTQLFNSICTLDYGDLNTILRSKGSRWNRVEFRYLPLDSGFPIFLLVYAGSSLRLNIDFDRTQFDDIAIRKMLGHLKTILEGMAENPNRSLAELPILTEVERRQVLVEWNDTKVDYAQDKLIHQIFEARVEKTPDAIALVYEGESLTYRELNRRANRLAHYLQSLGVGPETLVGIAIERSIEMMVGLYAILKAGGAYVPIDPTHPAERAVYMMEDAKAPVLLTQQRFLGKLPSGQARIICLDRDWDGLIANQSPENPSCRVTLDNAAYVIYTSGSTGKPKGVINTHGGILNSLLWMQDAYQLTASDRVLQSTTYTFDVSLWELFWPLLFGARLVIARPEGHKDNDYLVQTIIEQQITTIHFAPSQLQIFLTTKDLEKCTSLQRVLSIGEVLSLDLQNKFFSILKARLHNLYGPTEAAVQVTYWECQKDTRLKAVPIGRPIANTQIYILDRNMQPVPAGVTGELYIGGVNVARGYLNRPELTAERFIPDPFSRDPKSRLYKTGDLARYLPDGNIDFLGRVDFQVKIRGIRVELGEIEAALYQHPAVGEAVIVGREDTPGDVRLIAYIVPAQNQTLSIGVLRDYLKQKLPDFMVPSHFITLDKLPLLPNGKTDRKALPAPTNLRPDLEEVYIAPQTETERILTSIWQTVLRLEKIGIHDNFFELGGHSLLATQVVSRVPRAFEVSLPLRSFFEHPTVAEIALIIEKLKNSGAAPKAPPIVPLSRVARPINTFN